MLGKASRDFPPRLVGTWQIRFELAIADFADGNSLVRGFFDESTVAFRHGQAAIERVQKKLGMIAESKDVGVLGEAADAGSQESKDNSTESKGRIDPSKDKTDAVQGQNEAPRGTKTAGSKDRIDGVEGQNRTSSCPTHGTYIEYYTALNIVTNTESNIVINTEANSEVNTEALASKHKEDFFDVLDEHQEGLPRNVNVRTPARKDQQEHQQGRHHNNALVPLRTSVSLVSALDKQQVAQQEPTAPAPPRSSVSLDGTAFSTAPLPTGKAKNTAAAALPASGQNVTHDASATSDAALEQLAGKLGKGGLGTAGFLLGQFRQFVAEYKHSRPDFNTTAAILSLVGEYLTKNTGPLSTGNLLRWLDKELCRHAIYTNRWQDV